MKKRSKFVLTSLLTLLVMSVLVMTVSAGAAPWIQELIEEEGEFSFLATPNEGGEVEYNCEPHSSFVKGCDNSDPGRPNCYDGYSRPLGMKGIGCGMKIWVDTGSGLDMIDFTLPEASNNPYDYPHISAWRECETGPGPSDPILQKGYLGTYDWEHEKAMWRPTIFWEEACYPIVKAKFTWDPQTPTYDCWVDYDPDECVIEG